jgi:hypothetical protein
MKRSIVGPTESTDGDGKMAGTTGSTYERNLGRKVLDTAKYVGKNFWKVLPVGSLINFGYNELKKRKSYENPLKKIIGHTVYAFVGISVIEAPLILGIDTGAWTPKQYKEFLLEKKAQEQHQDKVNSNYNKLFENAASFEDSLRIANDYNIPYELTLKPSFEDKEG